METPNSGQQPPPSPPPDGGSTTSSTFETTSSASSKGTMILVLGILSIVCCGLLGPVAWYMGNKELKDIAAGLASAEGEQTAKIGMILGIVGTVVLGLVLLWMIFAGGMAVIGALLGV